MRELGTNAAAVSRKAKLGRDHVLEIVNGKTTNPGIASLLKIAQVLDCDLAYLVGKQEHARVEGAGGGLEQPIPVVGTVEAGVFSEMTGPEPWLSDAELPTIYAPHNPDYPQAKRLAFRVRGDSMNAATPSPIVEGQFALCIDFADSGLSVVDGEIYVVRRTEDSGQTYEWTLKRARIYRDRVDLVPESTNTKHKTISLKRGNGEDESAEVVVIGLVYATYNPLTRRGR